MVPWGNLLPFCIALVIVFSQNYTESKSSRLHSNITWTEKISAFLTRLSYTQEEQCHRKVTHAVPSITLNLLAGEQPGCQLVWLPACRRCLWPVFLSVSSLVSFPLSSFSMTSYVPASFLENCDIVTVKSAFRIVTVEKSRFYSWTQLMPHPHP